jgi:hypothetical protein
MKNKTKLNKVCLIMIAVFQILLLINFTFASSYKINKTTETIKNILFEDKIKLISAQEELWNYKETPTAEGVNSSCCPLTTQDEKCQKVNFSSQCKKQIEPYLNCDVTYKKSETEVDINGDPLLIPIPPVCPSKWKCCTKTNTKEICQDLYKDEYETCIGSLVSGSCEEIDCRLLNPLPKIPKVNNINLSFNCCPKTKQGAICQDIASVNTSECATNVFSQKCSEFEDCKIGCCVDLTEGLCTPRATKKQCEDNGGLWNDEESCNVFECQKGCCVLGSNVDFTTALRCERLSWFFGHDVDFRDIPYEPVCLKLTENLKMGACVLPSACTFTTQETCIKLKGEFMENQLCSNTDLNTSCKKQQTIGCLPNKHEIYWFDSCGNPENIYSSSKDFSWNNGFVLNKNQSCNPDSSNIDSKNCGNCNYLSGGTCVQSDKGVVDGNYICKDMNCIDENGKQWKNGESWCIYDSYVGDGKDTVGSRHWYAYCKDGEITKRGCDDYRTQLCVGSKQEINGVNYSFAGCALNEANRCLNYNSQENTTQKCSQNSLCTMKTINMGSSFVFDVCVGKHPIGNILTPKTYEQTNQICGVASQECIVVYKKNYKGDWKCKENCACKSAGFANAMNDLCVSLGDCGTYINYIGEGTKNIQLQGGSTHPSWQNYINYKTPQEDYLIKPNNDFLKSSLGNSFDSTENTSLQELVGFYSKFSGALLLVIFSLEALKLVTLKVTDVWIAESLVQTGGGSFYTTLGTFAMATGSALAGVLIGSKIAEELGLTGDGAAVMTGAGGVSGAMIYLYIAKSSFFNPYVLMGSALIMIYTAIIGWGKIRQDSVKFTCLPWQPQIGGKFCSECNNDPDKPCTEYRCSSLGTACKLVNENSENPTCESLPNDYLPPEISLNQISQGYEFNEEDKGKVKITKNNNCIPVNQNVTFVLETNEFAQCKYDFQRRDNYSAMDFMPAEKNLFSINHTFNFFMPSLDSLNVYDLSGDIKQMFGNTNMYLRCMDYHGNYNINEYAINFCITEVDLTAPVIWDIKPLSDSYLKYNVEEIPVEIYLNEPAECKYDVSSKPYDELNYFMDCKTDIFQMESTKGWPCFANFSNLNNDVNTFNIKCKDKPWLDEYNKTRNVHEEGYDYILFGSKDYLSISSTKPVGVIRQGFIPASFDLEVETIGGAEDGKSVCYYDFEGYSKNYQFLNTFSNYHVQNLNLITQGDYEVYLKCVDSAGNEAHKLINFRVEIDTAPPVVRSVYKDEDSIKIITNEDAECFYDFNLCNFNTKYAESMTIGFSREHTALKMPSKTYYVKCIDKWGNANPDCAIIVEPY